MLENNHQSMKTITETFLIEETIDLIHNNEQLNAWNKHVEELGLQGQTQIVKKDKSPIPFMHLKQSYKNICEQLCPRKVNVREYNVTPIPVEILELVSLSNKEKYFSRVEIWYDEKTPDPFAIGMHSTFYCYNKSYHRIDGLSGLTKEQAEQHKKENSEVYSFNEENAKYYLIGKWADVKRSWKELKEMATERFMAEKGNEYTKAIKEAKRGLEDLETEAFDKFN